MALFQMSVGKELFIVLFFCKFLRSFLEEKMPKTKFEVFIFTFITAWLMVYFMTLYNIILASASFTNGTFLVALKNMWFEFVIIFLCTLLISSPIAKFCAFRVVTPQNRPIIIIFAIQTFTVIFQVMLASILGTWHGFGFTRNFIPDYIVTYCRNFIMALPLQIILVGSFARFVFRKIFRRGEKEKY